MKNLRGCCPAWRFAPVPTPLRRIISALLVLTLLIPLTVTHSSSAAQAATTDRVFFPQTGHYLSYGFLDYWRHHGDVAIFGYPITEEFQQGGMTVQYFERAVFEYHPHNSPGWQVELRRLGADLLASRPTLGEEFSPSNHADPGCQLFSATEFQLCGYFLHYWEANGGLHSFGYPLSQPFTENGQEVQYFERALFEWHPENEGTPYAVLLGLLGRDAANHDDVNTAAVSVSPDVPLYAPDLFSDGSLKVDVPITFHAQQDPDWCDPADVQMWLESVGAPVSGPSDSQIQGDIWSYEIQHNDGFTLQQWHASPYAVAVALNDFGAPVTVGDAAFDDLEQAGLVISRSIAAEHQPVIALVDDGTHYVLVSGVVLGPGGVDAPPAFVTVYDPWDSPANRSGFAPMGQGTQWDWTTFSTRFTRDSTDDPGLWSGKWALIAAGLPLGQ